MSKVLNDAMIGDVVKRVLERHGSAKSAEIFVRTLYELAGTLSPADAADLRARIDTALGTTRH